MKLKLWRSLLLGLFLSNAIVYAALKSAPQAQAQISPDGTTDTTVNSTDNGIRIDEGDRSGDNLFHSFEQFSVPNDSEAFFNNSNDIVNIFSRVTGGDISFVEGLIRANGDASLFLINPAGVIFGEGAALDLGGSFFASTAESIVFTDDVEFSAIDATEPPLLTINQPLGLNFGNNPGDIAVNGSNLQVDNSETLTLFGGNVTITGGQIIAPGANIELGGLTAAGQISFTQSEDTFNSFSFPEAIARGNVTLSDGAEVNVQASGGGNIDVKARNLELSGASNLRTGIAPESTAAQAGEITINATGDITLSQGSQISNRVEESGIGNASNIKINTNNLFLKEGGLITTSIFGQGNAGEITINALDTILVDGKEEGSQFPSGIYSRAVGVGDSGGIDITTSNLSVTQGGQVNAGEITIDALDTISVDEGGLILATTFGQGDAGNLTVTASESIELVGSDGEIPSGLFANTIAGSGDGGNLTIATDRLIIRDEAVITVGNFQQVVGNREPRPPGTGAAGNLEINVGSVEVNDRGKIIADNANGIGGNLTLNADSLTLENEASVSASTIAESGQGGIVTLNIDDSLIMSDRSLISARADSGASGGNIKIDADFVIAQPNQNNDIVASAVGGTGGDIDVTTNAIFGLESRSSIPSNNTNDIDASSEFGLDGTVEINELDVNPTEALEELPVEVIDVAGLVEQNLCQQGQGSEFVVTGKGGTAPSPTQARDGSVSEVDLVKPVPFSEVEAATPEAPEAPEAEVKIVEAQGWVINDRGMVELVASKTDLNASLPQPQVEVCHK